MNFKSCWALSFVISLTLQSPVMAASKPFHKGITAIVSPANPIVGVTGISITGTATAGATIIATSTFPDLTVHTFSIHADKNGSYTDGPFMIHQLGTFHDVLKDTATDASTSVSYHGTGDFSLSVNPARQTVLRGWSVGYKVKFKSTSEFSGKIIPVALNWEKIPGAAASWSAQSLAVPSNGFNTATLTIKTSPNTPSGTYRIYLRGSNGSAVREIPSGIILRVTSRKVPVTAAFSPANPIVGVTNVSISGTATKGVPLVDDSTFPDGTVHIFSISTGSNGKYKDGPFVLQQLGTFHDVLRDRFTGASTAIAYSGVGDFRVLVNTARAKVQRGKAVSYKVTFKSLSGFSGTVLPAALNLSNIPGTTGSWSEDTVTVLSNGSASATFTVRASSNAPLGTYKLKLGGKNGSVTRATPFISLQIN